MNGVRGLLTVTASCMLMACGGSGGGGGLVGQDGGVVPAQQPEWRAGVFPDYSSLANVCEFPRPGTDDVRGSAHVQKMFLRSWSNDLYLWYDEIPDFSPVGYTVGGYFERLKSSGLDDAGQRKDRFHFTYDTAEWQALRQSGVLVDFGVQWSILSSQPPRRIVAAFVEPDSPAALGGIRRGDELQRVDSVDVISDQTAAGIDRINAALFPEAVGESYLFEVRRAGSSANPINHSAPLTAVELTIDPVPLVSTLNNGGVPVGYLLFNDHMATAEYELLQAIEQLRNDGVQELILDVRYNGGGYLDIASQLAYMIAGPVATAGRTFEALRFNDKHTSTDPVTGEPLEPVGFHATSRGFSDSNLLADNTPLPSLDLPRVYMIVGDNTCSASETIINGLRGVGVDVYLIGGTTCGKPYGYYPRDNCGTTYFSVQFQTLNEQGFGGYSAGFAPPTSNAGGAVVLEGCTVEDDYTRELGDPDEARLAAALTFHASNHQRCDVLNGPGVGARKPSPGVASDGYILKSLARSNLLLRDAE